MESGVARGLAGREDCDVVNIGGRGDRGAIQVHSRAAVQDCLLCPDHGARGVIDSELAKVEGPVPAHR